MQKPLETMIEQANIPGVSVASISSNGEMMKQAVGITNRDDPQKVTDATVFEAASLSKPVFAYFVLKMVERGELSRPGGSPESGLDRPLYEICPFGPPHLRDDSNYKLLTVRNILSHQAGLPNWFKPGEPEEYVATPGSRFDYSGLAFCFLNEVIEHVSGKSLHELSQEVFDDAHLKMNSSSFVPHEEGTIKRSSRAIGHNAEGVPDEKEHFPREFRPNPAASLFTTAEDYAKFLRACVNDEFIKKHMLTPQVELAGKDIKAMDAGVSAETLEHMQWGLGMGLQRNKDGQMIAFHWGDVETCRAFGAINLDTEQIVSCFTNSANGPLIFQRVAEPVVGDLHEVSQWLSQREGLVLNQTAMFRDAMLATRALSTDASSTVEDQSKPGFEPP